MKNCGACERPLTLNFNVWRCDHCDGCRVGVKLFRGWIIRDTYSDHLAIIRTHVFDSKSTAEHVGHFRVGADTHEVREVVSETEFLWNTLGGSVPDLYVAHRGFYVYPDHRHPPSNDRAYRAPVGPGYTVDTSHKQC